MKAKIFGFLIVTFLSISSIAQKVEVLYFKADLPCCRARACNMTETEIKSVIENNFSKGNVEFKTVRLKDETNKDLVEKYKAGSQTVIIVSKKRNKSTSEDITDIVRNYLRTNDKEDFENKLLAKIQSKLK